MLRKVGMFGGHLKKEKQMELDKLPGHLAALLYRFKGKRPEILDQEMIARFAETHLNRFSLMINLFNAGHKEGIRLDECMMYHQLWTNVVLKNCEWDKLDEQERGQVMDAYMEDHEDLMDENTHEYNVQES